MKTLSLLRRATTLLALAALALPSYANQVFVSFSGGNGSPIVVTLNPVTIPLTTGASASLFAIKGVFSTPPASWINAYVLSSAMSYTFNGGASINIDMNQSGWTAGAPAAAEDLVLFNMADLNTARNIGDVFVLSGTVTLSSNLNSFNTPASQLYDLVAIHGGTGAVLSGNATQIPEPGTYSAIVGVAVLGFVAYRRRQARA